MNRYHQEDYWKCQLHAHIRKVSFFRCGDQGIWILANASCMVSVIRKFGKQFPRCNLDQISNINPCKLLNMWHCSLALKLSFALFQRRCFQTHMLLIQNCIISLSHFFDNLPGVVISSWTEEFNPKSSQGRQCIFHTTFENNRKCY